MSSPPAERAHREIELKLEGPREATKAAFRHAALLKRAKGRARHELLRSLYFDTDDLALWRGGLTLRVRPTSTRTVQTLKISADPVSGLFSREEDEAAISGEMPDMEQIADDRLRERVRAATGASARALHPVVETKVSRERRALAFDGAKLEAALDLGEAHASNGASEISELELELESGEPAALYQLALALQEKVPELRPARSGKGARVLAQLAGDPPRAARMGTIEIEGVATLDAWLAAALRECARGITRNLAASQAGLPGGIHQMRVAARAARTLLRVFRGVLPSSGAKALRAELGQLMRVLGKVRDWDVLIEETLTPLCAVNAETELLIERARTAREQAQATLRAWLDAPRFAHLQLALGHFATGAPWRAQPLEARTAQLFSPACDGVGVALAGCQRRIERAARRSKDLTPAESHRLRLRVKEARYCAELAQPLFGKRARRYARRAAKLQDSLGEQTDAALARSRVVALEADEANVALVRAAGFAHGWIARGAGCETTRISAQVKKLARAGAALR